MAKPSLPTLDRASVVRFWFQRQGLSDPRGTTNLSRRTLTDHLERTGALQLDTINVVDRAHYLTLWSRYGKYDRKRLERWIYRDRAAYDYWGHEASILPISHLPLGRRRMRQFPPPSWARSSWWARFDVPPACKRRVLRRLRDEGPLESSDFEKREGEADGSGAMPLMKEDKRALMLLWHQGKLAIESRRHFRRRYDLADRVYPPGATAGAVEYEDSWLWIGLSGNGVTSERHLTNYCTGPGLKAPERKRVIERNRKRGRIVEVRVEGSRDRFFARPDDLERLAQAPEPRGTTLMSPFDSFLWQRSRAEELLGFRYRIEIYVPPPKRAFGYYVMPILHDGALVGRLDPKLHRDRGELEIKSLFLESGFKKTPAFRRGLADALHDLCEFLGAERMLLPRGWKRLA